MRKKGWIWTTLFTAALVGFTAYVAADTFLITRVYTTVVPESSQSADSSEIQQNDATANTTVYTTMYTAAQETETAETTTTEAEVISTERTYSDGEISIVITEYREHDTTTYVADVTISDASYLKTALAQDAYGKNVTEKTSEIAERAGAIFAINGDYYGVQESGYVIRNGVIYRATSADREDLVIGADGSFSVISESETTAEALLEGGAQQVLSFGPALVTGGEIAITQDEEVGKAMTSNPRTAIGIVDSLHYVFAVSNGRTSESDGLTLYQLAELM